MSTAEPTLHAPPAPDPWGGRRVVKLAGLVLLTTLVLHAPRVAFPVLLYDDFWFLRDSWTWRAACDNLWKPVNEHAMPLNRLTTWVLVWLAGSAPALPYVLALQGPLALLVCTALVYFFLARELGHPVYGLAGMALFGVTSQFVEAVSWYAATFALIALAFLLLGLLAAQGWRRHPRPRHLLGCVLWPALAPSCFAGGVLAGPLCALYLLLPPPRGAARPRGWPLVAAAPLLGTALFLAVSLPRVGGAIVHAEHYDGKSAFEAIRLDVGLVYSARSLADNLLLGTFGISGVVLPAVVVLFVLAGMVAAGAWWWRRASHRPLLLLGLAFVFSSYLLVYSARAEWKYEQIVVWSRYQVFAHAGLVLFLAGGLPRWHSWLTAGSGRWAPTRGRVWLTALLVFWVTQTLRCLPFLYIQQNNGPRQHAQLRRIEAVDGLCRRHQIAAADARAALEPLPMIYGEEENGWELLRGSDDPRATDPAEVRRLLGASQIEQLGEAGGDQLRAGHEVSAARPLAHLLRAGPEQPLLQLVQVALQLLEVLRPDPGLRRVDALVALPAHLVEQQRAVPRHQPPAAGGEQQQRRRRALADHDAGRR